MADTSGATRVTVLVRYFAAARAAAGVDEEHLTLPGPATVRAVVSAAGRQHGPGLVTVLHRCSFLLDELAVHGRDTPVRDGAVLDVLPPFAGG